MPGMGSNSSQAEKLYQERTTQMKILTPCRAAALAVAVLLSSSLEKADAQFVPTGRYGYYNPYTGDSYLRTSGFNPYTGSYFEGVNAYNRFSGQAYQSQGAVNWYTGGYSQGSTLFNPYTGRGIQSQSFFNPWTRQYGYYRFGR
jgi:hypothetical protein